MVASGGIRRPGQIPREEAAERKWRVFSVGRMPPEELGVVKEQLEHGPKAPGGDLGPKDALDAPIQFQQDEDAAAAGNGIDRTGDDGVFVEKERVQDAGHKAGFQGQDDAEGENGEVVEEAF